MNLPLLALAIAAFGIGTTEFVILGLLPEVAGDLSVSIPAVGMLVSAYALGVAVGGPMLAVVTARWPRKTTLTWLMVLFIIGNVGCALAPSYAWLMVARVVTSFCHAAFFGIGAVLAGVLAAFSFTSVWLWPAVITVVVWGMVSFAAGTPLQARVVPQAGDAPRLASTLNIVAFNLGKAIGAWLGGAVITAGWSLQAIPLVAAAVTLSALALTAYIAWPDRQPAHKRPCWPTARRSDGPALQRPPGHRPRPAYPAGLFFAFARIGLSPIRLPRCVA